MAQEFRLVKYYNLPIYIYIEYKEHQQHTNTIQVVVDVFYAEHRVMEDHQVEDGWPNKTQVKKKADFSAENSLISKSRNGC